MNEQSPPSFEAVYQRLEETVRGLEEGGLTLDQSIALYEEGMNLARAAQALLDQADLRVTTLQELFAGGAPAPDDGSDLDEED